MIDFRLTNGRNFLSRERGTIQSKPNGNHYTIYKGSIFSDYHKYTLRIIARNRKRDWGLFEVCSLNNENSKPTGEQQTFDFYSNLIGVVIDKLYVHIRISVFLTCNGSRVE